MKISRGKLSQEEKQVQRPGIWSADGTFCTSQEGNMAGKD